MVGALGVGAYAYYDTGQVASTAIEMFESEMDIEDADDDTPAPESKPDFGPKAKPRPKPTQAAKPRRHVVDNLMDKAVAGAARKVASTARKAAARKTRKPKTD